MTQSMQKERIIEHEQKRQSCYKQVQPFWHDLFGEPYALYDMYYMKQELREEIRYVTKSIVDIYDKTAMLLRELPDESLLELGIPKESVPFLRRKDLPVEGVIRRVDLVQTKDGWKHYEINSDTPTFIVECHHVNDIVASHFGVQGANERHEEQLAFHVQKAVLYASKGIQNPKIVFSAHDDHEEDWNTLSYLGKLSGVAHELLPLHELKVVEGIGLFTPNGEKIDVLYRQTYPIEHLVEDTAEDGTKVGLQLLELVQEGKLSIINPLSSFLLQSKAVQAMIWGLHEEHHPFFTEEEHRDIENYFLPTYLEKDAFLEAGVPFVEKPAFGREGDTIVVFDETGAVCNQNPQTTYTDSLKIYQEYVELPKGTVMTPFGESEAHLLIGSFVIGNEPGAIGIRAGEAITGNESCFLPIGIQK